MLTPRLSIRKISPLILAEDAIKIDSTGLSIEEVVEKITALYKKFVVGKN